MKTLKLFGLILVAALLAASSVAATNDPAPARFSPAAAPQPAYADWSQAGYPGDIPDVAGPIIDVRAAGAVGDGVTDDAGAIQAAIDAASNPAVIFFPAGTYRVQSQLRLKSGIVLRGEGYKLSHLECRNASGCLRIEGSVAGSFVSMSSGSAKGSTQIVVSDASDFSVGQGGELQQDDIVPAEASWGEDAVGQMVKIVAISGNTLTIAPALHIDFSLNPLIRPIRYVEQVGIEDLHLKRLSSGSDSDDSNVSIRRAASCWVRRVESDWTEKYHFAIGESLYLEIRDSYIHDAESKGDGGEGYGVSLGRHVTSILVENNIFNELRHAMIMQLGTNGCVFGYNYAGKSYSDDGWDKPAISVHGHYPFLNLYEGNLVGWASVDNVWGQNGPDNSLFRNRVVGTDRHQEFGQYRGIWLSGFHGPQYIVGNEINTIGSQTVSQDGIYIPSNANGNPADVVIHGNNIRGVLSWDPAYEQTLPASYYLSSKPAFYGALEWPSIGGDRPFGQATIPALARWESGDYIPSPAAPGPALDLGAVPADRAIRLSWSVEGSLPPTSTWQIDYYTNGSLYPAITGIISTTRSYVLDGLINNTWYTVTLTAIGTDPLLSATVRVMPSGISVYLPLIMRAY